MIIDPYRFGAAAPVGYRYFRLTISKWADAGGIGTSGIVRVAELQMLSLAGGIWFGMTSNTTNSGGTGAVQTTSASSILSTSFDAWFAFDGGLSDSSRWASASSPGVAQWIQMDLGPGATGFPITGQIAPDSAASLGTYPVDFKIDGSNTGAFAGEEHNYLTVTGLVTGWVNNTLRSFTLTP